MKISWLLLYRNAKKKKEIRLKYNNGEKCMKVPFIIYGGMKSLFKKIDIYHNNPLTSSMPKINKHSF